MIDDVDRSGSAVGPVDAEAVGRGLDEDVLETGDFPAAGAPVAAGGPIRPGGGSTGRGATDAGATDASGTPGGGDGSAGSAGG
jgi:hypothetical protein